MHDRRRPIERPDVRPSPSGPILVGTLVEDWYCADCNAVHPMTVSRCPCWPDPSANPDTLPSEFR
jgi:hypothetical protein